MSAERKVFGRLQGMAETPPDLIEIQTKSYQDFLQADVAPQKRENRGLQAIFKEVFPVSEEGEGDKVKVKMYGDTETEGAGYLTITCNKVGGKWWVDWSSVE